VLIRIVYPGLIYHAIKPKVVLLMFASRNIVLIAAKVGPDLFNGRKFKRESQQNRRGNMRKRVKGWVKVGECKRKHRATW
jgi:hypothetical protein